MKKILLLTVTLSLLSGCQKTNFNLPESQIIELFGENWRETVPYMTFTKNDVQSGHLPWASFQLGGSGTAIIDWGDGTPVKRVNLVDRSVVFNNDCENHEYSQKAGYRNTVTIIGYNITYVFCPSIHIQEMDLTKNPSLKELYCHHNILQNLDVSANLLLTSLDVEDNRLSALDLSNNLDLNHLSIGWNDFTTIDLSNNIALTGLFCGNNPLTTLDLGKNIALSELGIGNHNEFTKTKLKTLDLSNNSELTHLNCTNQNLSELDVSNNPKLESLGCSLNQIAELDIADNTELVSLDCSHNKLTALDVSNQQALKYLYCQYNQLNVSALNIFFKDLPNVAGPGLLYIFGNPGTNNEGLIQSIATEKGWIVFVSPPTFPLC